MERKFFINVLIAIVFLLFCINGFSNEDKSDASEIIKNIEGVYKHRFTNALANGEKYESEDIIEIVGHSSNSIYFRAELKFSNAHFCSIYGIAEYQNNSFVYKSSFADASGDTCVLHIETSDQKIKISDLNEKNESTCSRYYCGARGTLRDYEISMDKKRKIRYVPVILKSREYAGAIEEFNAKSDKK